MNDAVNNPPHYNQTGIECIDAIRAATGGGFIEDLKKARWYLNLLIEETNKDDS